MIKSTPLKLMLVLAAVLFVNPQFAVAQEADSVSSVGTLVAAALETAGYKALEIVLEDLGGMITSIAGLLFLSAIFIGLTIIAHVGEYRAGSWLIIGPVRFYFLTNASTQTAGADWQFGKERFEGEVSNYLGKDVTAKVPIVFHEYNVLVSGVIQELIRVLTNDDETERITFMVRQQVLDGLLRSNVGSPGLTALTRYTMQQCSDTFGAARTVAMGDTEGAYSRSPNYRNAQGVMSTKYSQTGIPIPEGETKTYLETLTNDYLPAQSSELGSNTSADTKPFEQCLNKTIYSGGTKNSDYFKNSASCEALWCMVGVGVASEVKATRGELEKSLGLTEWDSTDLSQLYSEVAEKLTKKGTTVSAEDLDAIVGAHLLKKIMQNDWRSKASSGFAEHWDYSSKYYDYDESMTEKEMQGHLNGKLQDQYATAQKNTFYVFAMLLPYVQGIMLYALAVSFPFFALYTVIPGKAGTFFTWMALWAWVKSWDVGYALVMVADNLLWSLMPHHNVDKPATDFNPVDVFQTAFSGDSAYSLANYYGLIGLMISSIPMLMGQLVMQGKRAVSGVMIDGLQKFSGNLGGSAADWVGIQQVRAMDETRERAAVDYVKSRFGKDVTPQLASERGAQESRDTRGAIGRWAPIAVGAVAVIGAGIFVVATGGLGAAAIAAGGFLASGAGMAALGVGSAAVIGGAALHSAGLKEQRVASHNLQQVNANSAREALWQFNATNRYRVAKAITSGLSGRGEYFAKPDFPLDVVTKLEQLRNKSEAQDIEIGAKLFGDVAGGIYDGTKVALARRGKV